MKFEKFVKSLGIHGVIHEKSNGEKWLSGLYEAMVIPENMKGLMARSISDMPKTMEEYINYELSSIPCHLFRAYMPEGDSKIKDCIRIFKSDDGRFECGIRNSSFALIEKTDFVEMYIGGNEDTFEDEPKALLIKRYSPDSSADLELVGLIMRYRFEKSEPKY